MLYYVDPQAERKVFGIFENLCHKIHCKIQSSTFYKVLQSPNLTSFFPKLYFVLFWFCFLMFLGEPDLHKNSEDLVNAEEKHETHS